MRLTKEESYKIQILRGLAIIAVVLIHNTPDGLPQVICRPFLNFSVGLFLFLSGYLSNVKKWNVKKRLVKVLIPYTIWTFIYTVLNNIGSPKSIPLSFVVGLIMANSAAVMYYIFIYCEFTVLIPLIDKLGKSKYKYLGFVIAPIEIIIMRLIPLVFGYQINTYLSLIMNVSCLGWFTYYYLGYLIGNGYINIKQSTKNLVILLIISILLQFAEGYWYLTKGIVNCGTQLKLTSILTGSIFALLAYKYLKSENNIKSNILHLLGNNSFGIYFSHLAIMSVLSYIGIYNEWIFYPFNAIIVIVLNLLCISVGKKILGRYSKYLALY